MIIQLGIGSNQANRFVARRDGVDSVLRIVGFMRLDSDQSGRCQRRERHNRLSWGLSRFFVKRWTIAWKLGELLPSELLPSGIGLATESELLANNLPCTERD